MLILVSLVFFNCEMQGVKDAEELVADADIGNADEGSRAACYVSRYFSPSYYASDYSYSNLKMSTGGKAYGYVVNTCLGYDVITLSKLDNHYVRIEYNSDYIIIISAEVTTTLRSGSYYKTSGPTNLPVQNHSVTNNPFYIWFTWDDVGFSNMAISGCSSGTVEVKVKIKYKYRLSWISTSKTLTATVNVSG